MTSHERIEIRNTVRDLLPLFMAQREELEEEFHSLAAKLQSEEISHKERRRYEDIRFVLESDAYTKLNPKEEKRSGRAQTQESTTSATHSGGSRGSSR